MIRFQTLSVILYTVWLHYMLTIQTQNSTSEQSLEILALCFSTVCICAYYNSSHIFIDGYREKTLFYIYICIYILYLYMYIC